MKKRKVLAGFLVIGLMFAQVPLNIFTQEQDINEEEKEIVKVETVPNEDEEFFEEIVLGQAHVTVLASDATVEVGRIAQYQVYVNVDGRQKEYENVHIQIQLPEQIDQQKIIFNQDENELSIRGVIPQYDENSKTLDYYFDHLEGGFETSLLINLKTVNGSSLDGVALKTTAQITVDGKALAQGEDTITLVANQNMSLSNKLKGIMVDDELQDRLSIKYLDTAVFSIGSSVNKFDSGSLDLKEESIVKITYTLAEGLTYIKDTSDVTPSQDGQMLTWEFNAHTNEDLDYFFSINFDIHVKVDGDLQLFSKVNNTATATVSFIDNSVNSYDAVATVIVSPNFEYQLEDLTGGGAYGSIFSGPSDNFGNVGWINNDDPDLVDGGLLGWNYYLTSLAAVHPVHGLNAYNVFFHPDENINIKNMYSGDFYYRPSSAFAQAGLQPIEEPVYYSVSIKYRDSDQWVKGESEIRPSTYYTAQELGIDLERKVETLWFHFHDNETHVYWDDVGFGNINDSAVFTLPAGLTTTNLRLWTTVDEGYVGSVESQAGLAYSGWNKTGNRVDVQSQFVPDDLKVSHFTNMTSDFESRLLPKTAQIVEPPIGISRYVKSNVYFKNSTNNLLDIGENKLILEIINDNASLRSLKGPFETYVLLEDGIMVNNLSEAIGGDVSIVTNNYKDTGKTLLKVVFSSENITISYKSTVSIPVTVTSHVPYNTKVEIYGYLDDEFEVSDVSNMNGTFTVKENDTQDFNGNGLEEPLFVTRNEYTFKDAYEFFGTLSASEDGHTFKNSVHVYEDGVNMMKITINNPKQKPISSMTLIGVLPAIDDTYIIHDENRNSKFSMSLLEKISLSEQHRDNFEIYYSTSKEPEIVDVLDINTSISLPSLDNPSLVDDQPWLHEDEVNDFTEIRSYKIVFKEGSKVIRDDAIEFTAPLVIDNHQLVGDENLNDRVAYSSYAVGINNASVFETQLLNFIYMKTPEYTLDAKDVTMKLSDVKWLVASEGLDQFVKEKALPVVSSDGVTIENANIIMEIVDRPEQFEIGTYDLLFSYEPTVAPAEIVTATTKLIIIDDEEGFPSEPEVPVAPEKPTVPNESEDPSVEAGSTDVETGINQMIHIYTAAIGLSIIAILLLKNKIKKLK